MSEKYLGEVSTPLLINQIKENCAQKRTTLPIASIDELGHIYQYMGATSGSLVHGYFYECVSDGQNPATYSWQQVNTQPTPATPTAATTTFNNTTSGLQATNVQGAIDEVVDGLGTAASKDFTTNVSPNNHALVESNAVYSAINNALTSVYTPRGNIACADLTSSLLIASNVGNVYNTTDSGTTTALFMQGAGIPISQNSTIGIIQTSPNTYLFNLMGNTIDLHDYQKKDLTSAVEGETTVEGALGALSTNNQATQAEVNDIVNVLGAKNILNNEVTTSSDWHGVSRTVNADGTITLNGTSTAWDFANFNYVQGQKSIPSGTYIISGGCENTALAVVADGNIITRKYGSGETIFTITDNMVETYARFEISSDKTFTSESSIIKPMIRLASDPDNIYVPYAMTNRELTDVTQITTLGTPSEVFSSVESGYTINDCSMYKQGKHVWGTFVLSKDSGDLPSSQTTVATLKFIPLASMNSWCACSGNRYGGQPFYIGYMWVASGNGQILVCNPSGTTSGVNTAKIMLDYCIA